MADPRDAALLTWLLFAIWFVVAAIGFVVFFLGRNAAFKRRWFPWYLAGAGTLFVTFIALMGAPLPQLGLMVPFVAVILWLNYYGTRFCDACGRTTYGGFPVRPRHCMHCGAALR